MSCPSSRRSRNCVRACSCNRFQLPATGVSTRAPLLLLASDVCSKPPPRVADEERHRMSAMTLPVFSQLLEPAGLAPALNFDTSAELVYAELPSIDYRA